jgi:hypothetical protein
MATTTNYGWTTPDDTALVKDGAAAIRTLGSSIDTSLNTALGTKKAGMVLLNTTSFSGVSSFSLPALTFTSTYDNYLVRVNFTASSSSLGLTLRLRAAGSDLTSGVYETAGMINATNSATVSGQGAGAQTSWAIADVHTTYPTYSQVEVTFRNPNTTNAFKTAFSSATFVSPSDTLGRALFLGLSASSATQYDSASFIASTGNFTGNYSVYGFNK